MLNKNPSCKITIVGTCEMFRKTNRCSKIYGDCGKGENGMPPGASDELVMINS